jgi:hypothetical protein
MNRLDQLFQQFLRERTYIQNVTASTREWYECAWKAFKAAQADAPPRPTSAPLISKSDLQGFVVHLRERGVKPSDLQHLDQGAERLLPVAPRAGRTPVPGEAQAAAS